MAAYTVINYSDNILQNTDKKRNIPIAPAINNFNNNNFLTNEAKRKGRVKEGLKIQSQQPPIAVARRNARERNRVKQVNNGFAVLRQHIPSSIATDTDNGRNKKLSKVETLKMAVEYIRRLEDLLSLSSSENEENDSMSSFGSYPVISSPNDDGSFQIKTEVEQKSPRKHAYQYYEDEENIHPDINEFDDDILSESNLMDSNVDLNGRNINFMTSIHSTGSLSPEFNSEHSLSPRGIENDGKTIYLSGIDTEDFRLKYAMLRNAQIADESNLIQMTSWWNHEQLKS